jgi:chorismate-pyruvate lyase
MKTPLRLLAALALPLLALPLRAQSTDSWPDTYLARLQAHALLQTLNANLLASTSATLTLEKWCADHAMAAQPRIQARLLRGSDKPASTEQRTRLAVGPETLLKYRRVQLYCGEHLMSEADNWYVPERLTPAMNRLLEETDTPFGKVVQPLAPYRRTMAARTLWSPLPEGWERAAPAPVTPPAASAPLSIPPALFEHSALLYTSAHLPIAEVRETYQRGVLAFPPPSAEMVARATIRPF